MVSTHDEDGWSHNLSVLSVLSVAAIIYCVMLLIALAVETVLAEADTEELHDALLIVLGVLGATSTTFTMMQPQHAFSHRYSCA